MSAAGHIVRSCYTGPYSFFTQVLNETSSSPLQYTETARLPVGTGGDIDIDVEVLRMLVQVMDANGEPRGVSIYRRVGTSWTREANFIPFPDGHSHMVMSGNGNFVAIGADRDRKAGMGPIYPPYQDGEVTGSVAVYERRASGWVLRRVVKQGSHAINSGFGAEVALDHRGHLLAVGATNDPSRARGIDGDREDDSMEGRGAVWIY